MLTDLGELPKADHRIIAEEINDARQIVGRSEGNDIPSKPFLWQHGEMIDLHLLIADPPIGLDLEVADSINNAGWIVVGTPVFVLAPANRPLGDVNFDCIVNVHDLIDVLDDWGEDKTGHLADIVTSATFQPPGDGEVDGADLAIVLGNWSFSTKAEMSKRRR